MSGEAAELLEHAGAALWPYLKDPDVEDLAIQRPGEIWICTRGKWRCAEAPITAYDIEEIAVLAGSLSKHEVDEKSPLCDEHLPGGERLAICMPPAVDKVPSLTLRKHEDTIAPTSSIKDRYRTEGVEQVGAAGRWPGLD